MGKAARFACIFIPMGLTIASLACLIFVFLGQREAKNSVTNQLYFFRADTSDFHSNPNLDIVKGTKLDDQLVDAIATLKSNGDLEDFYQVGLWDHCTGDKTTKDKKDKFEVKQCTKPEASYFFDIPKVWGLSTQQDKQLPKEFKDAMKAYKKVSHWMFVAYSVALGVTALEIVVGFFAIFSRWGSCVTSIVSSVSSLATIVAAITSTVVSILLVGAFESMKAYGVKGSLGTKMLALNWAAVAFSLGAGLFWTFSTCCCSGKSGYKRDGGIRRQGTLVEHLPYTHSSQGYKTLGPQEGGAPFAAGGASGMPMAQASHARHQSAGYEPYRTV